MIYDLTTFVGELDLLEIRLETLKDVVDKFIILEPKLWHNNTPKPLYFLENISRFDKFKDKIIYNVAESREPNFLVNYQRYTSILFDCIPNPKFDDIIHFSDLDEICHSHILEERCKNLTVPLTFEADYYMLCADLWTRKDVAVDIIMKHGWFKDHLIKYRESRSSNFFTRITNGSFHYSTVGTPENIVRKFLNFAHLPEIGDKRVFDVSYIRQCIQNREFLGDKPFKKVDINYQTAPKYLVDNKEKYKHLFCDYYDR